MTNTTDPMTEAELRAAEERCERATEGPWATYDGGWREHARAAVNPWRFMHVVVPIDGPPKYPGHVVSEFIAELKDAQDAGAARIEADAAFIAHARTDLPRALREIRRLRDAETRIGGLEQARDKAHHDLRVKSSLYEMALKDIERLEVEIKAEAARRDGLEGEVNDLRALLREASHRLRPLPRALTPEDHEPDTLPARIAAALGGKDH